MTSSEQFESDWASPPGETLLDMMQPRALSTEALASRLQLSTQDMAQLLSGKISITRDLALALSHHIGPSAEFWLLRESRFREALDRTRRKSKEAAQLAWLRSIPASELSRRAWIGGVSTVSERIAAILQFFDVKTLDELEATVANLSSAALFRTSHNFSNLPGPVAAWLRRGEILALRQHLPEWNLQRFHEIQLEIRELTRQRRPDNFLPPLRRLCATSGVSLVVVRTPTGCRASGATRFVGDRPIIQMSFRYLTDDQFWFTFFHESAHLLLHNPKHIFLEGDFSERVVEEKEANSFSASLLVPNPDELHRIPLTKRGIRHFAQRIGVSPGIVVGQLQHSKVIDFSEFNFLKARFNWEQGLAED